MNIISKIVENYKRKKAWRKQIQLWSKLSRRATPPFSPIRKIGEMRYTEPNKDGLISIFFKKEEIV